MKHGIAYGLLISAFGIQLAYAHAELLKTGPADHATVAAPQQITLDFDEPVRLTALSLQPSDGKPRNLKLTDHAMNSHFAVAVSGLGAGGYTVEWRALSDDGHIERGEFSFRVEAR